MSVIFIIVFIEGVYLTANDIGHRLVELANGDNDVNEITQLGLLVPRFTK